MMHINIYIPYLYEIAFINHNLFKLNSSLFRSIILSFVLKVFFISTTDGDVASTNNADK